MGILDDTLATHWTSPHHWLAVVEIKQGRSPSSGRVMGKFDSRDEALAFAGERNQLEYQRLSGLGYLTDDGEMIDPRVTRDHYKVIHSTDLDEWHRGLEEAAERLWLYGPDA